MAKSILKSISALTMSFLLAFTVYVLNKMLTTKKNSYELAKAKKEQAKRKKKKKQQKGLEKKKVQLKTAVDHLKVSSTTLEPQKPRIRRKKKRKPNDQLTVTGTVNLH